jgi:hypothetical protein
MAQADWGFDVGKHYHALRAIHEGGPVSPMGWFPREVLSLTRWGEPGHTDSRGQLQRAFAAALLLCASVEASDPDYAAAAQLLCSALALGTEVSAATLRFFAWAAHDSPEEGLTRLVFGLALVTLAMHLMRSPEEEAAVTQLAGWVVAEEERVAAAHAASLRAQRGKVEFGWLCDLMDELARRAWRAAIQGWPPAIERLPAGPLRASLQRLCENLAGAA